MSQNVIRTGVRIHKFELNEPKKKSGYFVSLKKYLQGYCEVSSIQGLNYLSRDGISCYERFWWIVILLLCLYGCSYMIYEVCDKWITTPVLVSLATKERPIYDVPFPAVTVCPETKISKTCLDYSDVLRKRRMGLEDDVPFMENMYFDYMSLMCRAENHENSTGQFTLDDYSEFLFNCRAIDVTTTSYCQWMGEDVDCDKILTPIITDEGLCYTFNMFDVRDIYSDINTMKYFAVEDRKIPNWNMENGYPKTKIEDVYPIRGFQSGAQNSLVIAFFTNKSDIYYSCRDFELQGIRVSLHMPTRIPRPSQVFFSVGLNRLATVAVTPTMMTTTPKVVEYDPHKRNCFFANERSLKYFKIYTQANCNMECWTNYTIHECGCVNFYMPRDKNTSICGLQKRNCLNNATISYPKSVLSQKIRAKNQSNVDSDCECLPVCTDLNYNAEISSGVWDWNNKDEVSLDQHREYFDNFHASAVKIFFKNGFFLPYEKSELYGITDFISNIGGILGLFTGFSLFSVAEIIYFLSIRIIENYRHYGYWAGERKP